MTFIQQMIARYGPQALGLLGLGSTIDKTTFPSEPQKGLLLPTPANQQEPVTTSFPAEERSIWSTYTPAAPVAAQLMFDLPKLLQDKYSTPNKLKSRIDSIREYGKSQGWSPERIQQEIEKSPYREPSQEDLDWLNSHDDDIFFNEAAFVAGDQNIFGRPMTADMDERIKQWNPFDIETKKELLGIVKDVSIDNPDLGKRWRKAIIKKKPKPEERDYIADLRARNEEAKNKKRTVRKDSLLTDPSRMTTKELKEEIAKRDKLIETDEDVPEFYYNDIIYSPEHKQLLKELRRREKRDQEQDRIKKGIWKK